jgi:hypothetical protein
LRSLAFEDVEDSVLAELDDELAEEEGLGRPMGATEDSAEALAARDRDLEDCPFDVAVAQPRAISLLKLYELTGSSVPAAIEAAIGRARVPLLIVHQMTPFSRFGYPPTRVWGLGYHIQGVPDTVTPMDFAPKSEFLEVASVGGELVLGLSGDGKLELPDGMGHLAQALTGIPGLAIDGLSAVARAESSFRFAFNLKVQLLKIKAGIDGRGVRWDFYEQDERMDRAVTLLQTALVPEDTRSIGMTVRTWVRRRRRVLGIRAARSWIIPPRDLTVDVEH